MNASSYELGLPHAKGWGMCTPNSQHLGPYVQSPFVGFNQLLKRQSAERPRLLWKSCWGGINSCSLSSALDFSPSAQYSHKVSE